MECEFKHRGVTYSPADFVKLLKNPIFAEEVRISIVTDSFLDIAMKKQGIEDVTSIAKELADKNLFGKNMKSEMAKIRLEIARRHLNGEDVKGMKPTVKLGAGSIWAQIKSKGLKELPKIMGRKIINIPTYLNQKLGQGPIKGISKQVYEFSILKDGKIREQLRLADLNAAKLNSVIKKYDKFLTPDDKLSIGEVLKGKSPDSIQLKNVKDPKQKDAIRSEISLVVSDLRKHIDDTTRKLIASGYISESGLDIYQNNLGQYVTRIYEVNIHPKKWWDKLTTDPLLAPVLQKGKDFIKSGLQDRQARVNNLLSKLQDRIIDENKLPDSPEKTMNLEVLQKRYDRLQSLNLKLNNILSDESLLLDYIEEGIGATGDDLGVVKSERSQLKTDQSIFKKRGNIPEEIRALKGEVTDADAAYAATIKKMIEFDAKYNYQMAFALFGEGVLFSTERDTGRGFTERMSVANLPGIRDVVVAKDNEIYVTPEIADEFSGAIVAANNYVTAVKTINTVAKWGATVGNPITQLRNFSSAFTFMLYNGNLLSPAFLKVLKTVATEIKSQTVEGVTGKDTRSPLLTKVFDSAVRNGVVNNSIDIKEISDLFKNSWWDRLNRNLETFHKSVAIPTKILSSTIDVLNSIYAGSDNIIKVASYLAELDRYAATIGDYKSYEDITSKAESGDEVAISDLKRLEYVAAKKVRETVPNYSESWRANKVIRENVPLVGTFTTFTTEMIRTQYNGIITLKDELSKSVDDNLTSSQKAAHRKILFYRMLGFSVTYAATFGQEYIREALAGLGDDDEEEKEWYERNYTNIKERDVFVKYYAPPWVRMVDLQRDLTEDGAFIYSDPSSLNPYSTLNNFSLWDRTKSESNVGKLSELIAPVLSPFFNPEMGVSMLKRYLDNEDDLGRPISEFSITDNSNEFLKDFWRNEKVRAEILPGVFKEFSRYEKKSSAVEALQDKLEGGNEKERKKWLREIKEYQQNMAYSLKAYKYFGFKQTYVNLHTSAQYAGYDFVDKVDALKTTYAGRVKDKPKEFQEIYDGLNTQFKKELNKMRTMMNETKNVLHVDVTPDIEDVFGIKQVPNKIKDYIFGKTLIAPDLDIKDYSIRSSLKNNQ